MFREFIKKLNNFKVIAWIVSVISAVAAAYGVTSMFLYHFAGDPQENTNGLIREVGFHGEENGAYKGMVLFFMIVAVVGVSIFVIYSMIPFILNKEKLNPKKGLLLTGFVVAFFEIVLIVFMFLLAFSKNEPNTKVAILATAPFGILSTIGLLLLIVPYIKCDFYMPEISKK